MSDYDAALALRIPEALITNVMSDYFRSILDSMEEAATSQA
jgi:hypothetical protein